MPYTYAWSNAATTASITGVTTGTYSVTITDANGCTDSSSTIITEPAVLVAASVVDSNVTCNGFTDGGATASATGGTGAYTYTWSNAATTASITGVAAGTYSVTITDNNGCTATSSATITEPTAIIAASVVDSNVTCNGFTDGGATASATGGTGAYTFAWSNSATTASITGVAAGTYTVTTTDANGCTATSSATITEPASLVAASVVDSNISCNGLSDGGATGSATGGTAPYTYAWSNSATTASITGVIAGTYSVTITDNNGCTNATSATITEPASLVAASVVDSNASCNGFSDAGATASATGGTMPYTYAWSNAATTASITGVTTGTYSVTITDANGCTNSSSNIITFVDTIKPTVITKNINAYLNTSGSVNIIPSDIDNGSSDACGNPTLRLSNSSFGCADVGANNIYLIATDVNGNIDSAAATVTVIDSIKPTIITQGATVYLDAAGVASITTAEIDNGSTDICGTPTLSLSVSSFTCSEEGSNTVYLIASDVNGNIDSASATVTVIDSIKPTITCLADTTICSSTFTFTTPTGNDNCSIASVIQTAGIASGGTYPVGTTTNTFVITDVNGNIDSCSFTVTRDDEPTIAVAGSDVNICLADYQLSANNAVVGNGLWTTPGTATFDDATAGTTTARGLSRGDNILIWTISNGVCNSSIDTVNIIYDEEPTSSIAGLDQILCEEHEIVLNGNSPNIGNGAWTTHSGSGLIGDTASAITSVSGLGEGINKFIWTVSNGTCDNSLDTVSIIVAKNPIVNVGPDQSIFKDDGTILDLTINPDSLNNQNLSYQWSPSSLLVDPSNKSTETDPSLSIDTEFKVTVITEQGCIGSDSLFVSVKTLLEIPSAFTPNGDGINDTWEIKNFDQYAKVKLVVYDGFGSEIYTSTNYDYWDGKRDGNELPLASYYYVIEVEEHNGNNEVLTGIVTILK
jgi:gliding motility-associated-like protein